ncbi:MAG: type II toxin-antitoxin system RelE/ParE family toxin [Clostridia bacterium]|nr:type II toxin-antitoxin system RelE/ParE family toxin [Clostridia bacterium]
MADINFSPDALEDIKEIKAYITDELCSEQAAINTIKKIMKRIRQLEDFPKMGTLLSSIVNIQVPYRFLVCGNYTAFYKIENNEIHITRILYGRRNFMQILFGKSFDEKK